MQIGGVVSYLGDAGNTNIVRDVVNEATVSGELDIGGIAGWAYIKETILKQVINRGSVQGGANLGGIIGRTLRSAGDELIEISDVVNYGNVAATVSENWMSVGYGGIIGSAEFNATINGAINYGNISSIAGQNGTSGIVGFADSSANIQIDHAYNVGKISGVSSAGGIIGESFGKTSITNVYNAGNISSFFGGGLIGYNAQGGRAENSVAINSRVGKCSEFCGDLSSEESTRIRGIDYDGNMTLKNLYGLKNMVVNGKKISSTNPNGTDGKDVTPKQLYDANWWKNTAKFSEANWDFSKVNNAYKQLPRLKGTDGKVLAGQNPFPDVRRESSTVTYSKDKGVKIAGVSQNRLDSIVWLADKGVTIGSGSLAVTGQMTYRPQDKVTRGAMAQFLQKLAGVNFKDLETKYKGQSSKFSDTENLAKKNAARFYAIEWLADSGLTSGCADKKFCPNSPVTRGAMAEFMQKFAGVVNIPETISSFPDVVTAAGNITYDGNKKSTKIPALTPARIGAINWLASVGITAGSGQLNGVTTYRPQDPVTRGSMAEFLQKLASLSV
ncbi:MAG: S-layer homology domain-containing protein [Bifidobacteriaceae bacterium]|nr:S-layer homology domain-containing protein [Bifidobacteriaceae bacterium]